MVVYVIACSKALGEITSELDSAEDAARSQYSAGCYYTADYHEELGETPTDYEMKRTENGYMYRYYRIDPHSTPEMVEKLRKENKYAPIGHLYDDHHNEEGKILNRGTKNEELVVMGSYNTHNALSFNVEVVYTADKNGYRPHVFVKKFDCEVLPSIVLLKNLSG